MSVFREILIFGSFVSTIPSPRDVDIVLIMENYFKLEEALRECHTPFSHTDADARFGASIFWPREGMIPSEVLTDMLTPGG